MPRGRGRRARRPHLDVAAEEGLRLARERTRQLRREAADAHQRRHPEGDADECDDEAAEGADAIFIATEGRSLERPILKSCQKL